MERDTGMFGDWLRSTGFLLAFALVLSSFSAAAPARADEPGAEFKLWAMARWFHPIISCG
jgi:hypothetical protein